MVSMKGPNMATNPSRIISCVLAAAWAMGAEPRPASLLKTPRATPFWMVCWSNTPAMPPPAATPDAVAQITELHQTHPEGQVNARADQQYDHRGTPHDRVNRTHELEKRHSARPLESGPISTRQSAPALTFDSDANQTQPVPVHAGTATTGTLHIASVKQNTRTKAENENRSKWNGLYNTFVL